MDLLTREQLEVMAKTNRNPLYLSYSEIAKTALALLDENEKLKAEVEALKNPESEVK